jgi:hypothetical protein
MLGRGRPALRGLCERDFNMDARNRKRRSWNSAHYPKMVTVRVTTEEHAEILRVAGLARMSASRLLATTVIKRKIPALRQTPPPTRERRQEMEFLLYELRKIGVNLNQLAHRTNRARLLGRFPPPRRKVDEASAAIEGLVRLIRSRI